MEEEWDDPIVSEFLDRFGADEGLAAELDDWCNERCMIFKGTSFDGEHRIEFTELHLQYVAEWEARLESFLAAHGLQANDLASRFLRFRRRKGLGNNWVPRFVADWDYQTFFDNMSARAEGDTMEAAARTQAQAAAATMEEVNLSGVFKIDLSRTTSVAEIDRVSKLGGAPFPFRKLYCRVLGRMTAVVNHDGPTVQFQLKIPFFSTKTETYIHDGEYREGKAPIMGGSRHIKSWHEGNVFRTAFQLQPDSMEGADIIDVYYESDESKDVICLRQTTYFVGGEVGEILYGFVRQ